MLTSLVLTLAVPEPLTLPPHLGRASHALLLRLIREREPALAEELHASDRPRPFTCSNLIGGRRAGDSLILSPADAPWLRFTSLTAGLSAHLTALAADPPAAIELDGARLPVTGATLDASAHPWAGRQSYTDLMASCLNAPSPQRRLLLEFASPTTFRSGGKNLPFPLPALVFGSLLDRWQAFSPAAVHPDTRRYAEEMLALARYDLRTRILPLKSGSRQVGFLGQVGYLALNADRYWLDILGMLASFAFYAGVGYQTAVGMGQTRAISAWGA